MTPSPPPGLQAERTGLAWSRTSLGVAANAALVAARDVGHLGISRALLPAVLALVVAAGTALYARRRTRALRGSSPPQPARVAVPVLGAAVVALAVVTGLALVP